MKKINQQIKTMIQQQIIVQTQLSTTVRPINVLKREIILLVRLVQKVIQLNLIFLQLQVQIQLLVRLKKLIKTLPMFMSFQKVMFMFTMQMSMVTKLKTMSQMKKINQQIKTTIQQQTTVQTQLSTMVRPMNWYQQVTIQQVKLIHKVTGQAMMLQQVKLSKVIRTSLTSTNLKNNLKVMFMFTMQMSMAIRLKMMSQMKKINQQIKTTIQQQTTVQTQLSTMVRPMNWYQQVTIQQVKLIHKVTGQAMMLQLVKLSKVIRTSLTSTNLKKNHNLIQLQVQHQVQPHRHQIQHH